MITFYSFCQLLETQQLPTSNNQNQQLPATNSPDQQVPQMADAGQAPETSNQPTVPPEGQGVDQPVPPKDADLSAAFDAIKKIKDPEIQKILEPHLKSMMSALESKGYSI